MSLNSLGVGAANALGMTGNNTLGIDNLDIGFSASGLEEYKATLEADLIAKTEQILNNQTAVIEAINAGWQGKSRDVFLGQFSDTVTHIIEDLNYEYEDLLERFKEIQNNYYEQDENLMND